MSFNKIKNTGRNTLCVGSILVVVDSKKATNDPQLWSLCPMQSPPQECGLDLLPCFK